MTAVWGKRLAWAAACLVLLVGAVALLDATLFATEARDDPPPLRGEDGVLGPVVVPGDTEIESVSLSRFTVESEAVGENLAVSVLEPNVPARPGRRPLLVFLHGAGGSDETSVNDPAVLEALEDLGPEAPLIAFPDGRMSWWRKRADGDWGRYVVAEVIPAVTRRYRTDPRRVAIGGISMGGFGAYYLGMAYPRRFCAVGGHSAGLYLSFKEAQFESFDNRRDFRRNNLVARVQRNPNVFGPGARIWNDYGKGDWFVAGNERFVKALRRGNADLTAHVWPGGHDGLYWSRHWPDYLRFYSRSLKQCNRAKISLDLPPASAGRATGRGDDG